MRCRHHQELIYSAAYFQTSKYCTTLAAVGADRLAQGGQPRQPASGRVRRGACELDAPRNAFGVPSIPVILPQRAANVLAITVALPKHAQAIICCLLLILLILLHSSDFVAFF